MTHAHIGKKFAPDFSLDLDLPLAGVTALYGPERSGKSLALELIAGFVAPDSGRILLEDAILFDAESGVNITPRRRRIAWIGPQDTLFPHMSLEQNLKFAANHLPRLERHRAVAETLERFRLLPKSRAAGLATSDRLRAAAARAIVAAPKLLLVDDCAMEEPLLREIRAAAEIPILLVTRSLDLCCATAGTLVLLDKGRIVQRGAPAEVIGHPDSIEAARILGIPNLLQGTIAALDPGRNTSRIDFEGFSLTAPYIKGHFRGDQIWVAIHPRDLRAHPGDEPALINAIPVQLVRTSHHTRTVQLEFAGPIVAEISHEDYARQRDNKVWQLEIPPQALKVL